ncbi:carbohydrate ABC transporter permease [Anaeromassilibacillus sp. SJQ-5]
MRTLLRHRRRISRSAGGNFLVALFLLLLGAFMLLPIYYTVVNSLKPIHELFLFPPRLYVTSPTLDNFRGLIRIQGQAPVPFERYAFNSLFVTVAATGGFMLAASMAAYPLAKHRFPGKKVILQLVVFAILFRTEVTAVPQYILMVKTRLIDTYAALILPALATSFGVFLMTQFAEGIPEEILESARIDGAKEIPLFFRMVLPMVRPAWLTLGIFTFTSVWSTTGTQFIYSEELKMLPAMLAQIGGAGLSRAGVSAAVSVLLMVPPVVMFLFCQRSVIETMAHSGLKS